MTDQDRPGFATLMVGLGVAYEMSISDVLLEIYFAALEDIDLAVLRRAATTHVRTSKFFPRPSELREAVSGSQDDRAETAWMALLRMVRTVGYTGQPTWGDDVALKRAALELYGGWVRLCSSLPADGPELLGYRKAFLSAYRAYDSQAQRSALPDGGDSPRELSAAEARSALSLVMKRAAAA